MEVLDLPRKSHLCLLCFIATQNLVWSILVGHAPYSWGVLFTILNYISYVFFVQRCVCPRMYVVCNHASCPSLLGAPRFPSYGDVFVSSTAVWGHIYIGVRTRTKKKRFFRSQEGFLMPATHCKLIPWSSSLHPTPIKKGTTDPCTSEKEPLHTLSRAPEHPHLPQALDHLPFILAQTRWYASKYSGYVRSLAQQEMVTEDRKGKGKRGEWEICQQVNRSKLLRQFRQSS
jgi:hypothetical protein